MITKEDLDLFGALLPGGEAHEGQREAELAEERIRYRTSILELIEWEDANAE